MFVVGTTRDFLSIWHEKMAGRGRTEVTWCLSKEVMSGSSDKKYGVTIAPGKINIAS